MTTHPATNFGRDGPAIHTVRFGSSSPRGRTVGAEDNLEALLRRWQRDGWFAVIFGEGIHPILLSHTEVEERPRDRLIMVNQGPRANIEWA
jgi:hypothetical protein